MEQQTENAWKEKRGELGWSGLYGIMNMGSKNPRVARWMKGKKGRGVCDYCVWIFSDKYGISMYLYLFIYY